MKQGRLSSGSASIGQLMLVIFFAPFMLFLCYSVLNKTTNDGLIFLAVVTGVVILIFKNAISYADVSIEGRSLLIEKFFFVRKKSVDEFKLINSAILPFTYYIEFTDGKKVYFFLRYSEIFKQFFGSDSDKFLIDLRKMFNDEKDY
ncbi:hypothetical protein WSM22_03650 [Cytophagales bacterium WSM2-2]|nr:hypothetical protein WSM22_03650 [Cytophagales bacterium WSM2-2]